MSRVISKIDKYVIEKIKEKRQEADITQYDLAHQLVAPRTLISMVESGRYNRKYSLAQINEIAKILDCSIYDLFPEKPL